MKLKEKLCWTLDGICVFAIIHWAMTILAGNIALAVQFEHFKRNHTWLLLDAPGWASWVQAIGSVGAIIGAIWISNRAVRQEQIRNEIIAILAASECRPPLEIFIREFKLNHQRIIRAYSQDMTPPEWIETLSDIQGRPKISPETIVKLSPFGTCALDLTRANAELTLIEEQITALMTNMAWHGIQETRGEQIWRLQSTMDNTVTLLDAAIASIIRATTGTDHR